MNNILIYLIGFLAILFATSSLAENVRVNCSNYKTYFPHASVCSSSTDNYSGIAIFWSKRDKCRKDFLKLHDPIILKNVSHYCTWPSCVNDDDCSYDVKCLKTTNGKGYCANSYCAEQQNVPRKRRFQGECG